MAEVGFILSTKMPYKYSCSEGVLENIWKFAECFKQETGIMVEGFYFDTRKRQTIITFRLGELATVPDETKLIMQIGTALHQARTFGMNLCWTLSGWECHYVRMQIGGADDGRDQELALEKRVHGDTVRGSVHDLLAFWR